MKKIVMYILSLLILTANIACSNESKTVTPLEKAIDNRIEYEKETPDAALITAEKKSEAPKTMAEVEIKKAYEKETEFVHEAVIAENVAKESTDAFCVEVENSQNEEKKLICTMTVSCKSLLENIEKLKPEKRELLPENGIIFYSEKIEFEDGESVFDILKREMQKNKIQLEFSINPDFNTAYIEGINNFYEFDCGDMSGWIYLVNGKTPGIGCSQYLLKDGDTVEWIFRL